MPSVFFGVALHLWTEFSKGLWRHGRRRTLAVDAITFVAGINYLSQTNFGSQWIGVQAKDALNSISVGSFFNVLNFGQMLSLHVLILPLFVVLLVDAHILQIRTRGVVRP